MKIFFRNSGIQAGLASALFLGVIPVFGKQSINVGFAPLAVTAFRTTIAMLLLLSIMSVFKRQFFYIYPIGLAGCFLAGTINGLGSLLYYNAIQRLDTSVAHLIYSFYPIFVAFLLFLDRSPISKITIFRLALSIPGVYLLLDLSGNSVDMGGILMMFGASLLYALHLIINQRILVDVPAPTVTLYTLIAMSATVIIAYLIGDRSLPPSGTPYWPLLAMAFFTFLSRITLFMGVKHLGGLQTALLGLGELVVTIGLAYIWLGDRLTVNQWVGAFLICVNVFLVGFDKITPQKRKTTGILAWLNPPQIVSSEFPWKPEP
ncbi:MAG: hypothetical protein CL609_22690 [Anaerolineaceae bacterium]|nr:hypothetical protein [Anaerolineaceae bacterium]